MSAIELRKQLFEKIQKIENKELLEEAYRLLELETDDVEIYKVNDSQNKAIIDARQQIENGQTLPDSLADKEIDEWLNK